MAAWHVTRGMAHVTRHAAWHVLHTSRDGFLQGASASHRIASHRIAVTRMRAHCAMRTNATLPRCRVQACGMSQHGMPWHGMAARQRTASATGGVPTSPRCDVHAHVGWGRTTPPRRAARDHAARAFDAWRSQAAVTLRCILGVKTFRRKVLTAVPAQMWRGGPSASADRPPCGAEYSSRLIPRVPVSASPPGHAAPTQSRPMRGCAPKPVAHQNARHACLHPPARGTHAGMHARGHKRARARARVRGSALRVICARTAWRG